MSKSEFGKGLCYNLGLFLAHEQMFKREITENNLIANIWFNGASDHLYELQIPKTLPKSLQKRLKNFQEKCLDLGHGSGLLDMTSATKEDIKWAVQEAKDLLMEIDKAHGIKVSKGHYE